jgi:hypothetical protein
MKFTKKIKGLLSIRRRNYSVSKEVCIYTNKNIYFFGITKSLILKNTWCLMHLPSERAVICVFKRKKDAEKYVKYLSKQTDINSILLCSAEFKHVEREIKYDVEIAYRRYYSEEKTK